MKKLKGPFPSPQFNREMAANVMPPLSAHVSGEITSGYYKVPAGAVRTTGRIQNVWMSVGGSGKDDSNPLMLSGECYINGVTCLSTKPCINHISGEAAQQKTTSETGDTGITQAVVNASANSVTPGDVITCDFVVDRTASPTTEINNPIMVIEFEPIQK